MKTIDHNVPRRSKAMADVDEFKANLGPFVVAAEKTRMPMIFTRADDSKHAIIYANDSFLSLTGYSGSEVIGEGICLILANQADQAIVDAALHNPPEGQEKSFHLLCKRRSGATFLAAMYSSPVIDERGNIAQYFASFVDLDEHIKIVDQEQARTCRLYQDAPGFIAMSEGADHRFTFANDAFKKLIGERPLVGKSVVDAVPEVQSQGLVEILDYVFQSGQPHAGRNVPLTLQRVEGAPLETRYVDFIYQPMRNEDGQISGLFCEGHDVTEQKEIGDELRLIQAELIYRSRVSAMGTMASTLAHELNQPLAAISNYVGGCRQLLTSEGPDSEKLADGLQRIGDASVRAGHIIRRLRDMTARSKSLRKHFNLADAQREAVALVQAASCEGVNIIERHGKRAHVYADQIQVQQVIVNLVKNACEATALASLHEVSVSTEVRDGKAILSVSDSGGGVSSELADSLFTWSDSTKSDGMGIGLAISRTIIDAQGGRIWLDQTNKDGARFCFSLPLAASIV